MPSQPDQGSDAEDLRDVATGWLREFENACASGDARSAADLFVEDCHWRDILTTNWHFYTFSGRDEIELALAEALPTVQPTAFRVRDSLPPRTVSRGGRQVLEVAFDFAVAIGSARGVVRLVVDGGQALAWTMMTQLDRVDDFVHDADQRRTSRDSFLRVFGGDNWLDRRETTLEYRDRDPEVLVVGGGQCGLGIAAHLSELGIDALIIDKLPRPGDNWRQRYHSLLLHNASCMNHLPLVPFPDSFPTYLPKDKLANWFEHYVDALDLNFWGATSLVGADFDPVAERWTVRLRRDSGDRVLHPQHVVIAVGVSGAPKRPDISGLADFAGEVQHAASYSRGADYVGRRAVVFGTGTSAHDVAQDLYCAGAAEVTMIQRGAVTVTNLETSQMLSTTYFEGLPLEDADLLTSASPYPAMLESSRLAAEFMADVDKDLLEGLARAGMQTDTGEDGTGFQMKYFRRGGGYYLNVGCSDLIVDGSIKVRRFDDIDRIVPAGIRFVDGSILEADAIFLATGFKTIEDTTRDLFGDDVADRVGQIWGYDADGELANMYKRTPQENLWFQAGSLIASRVYAKFLALQIKARLAGIIDARIPPKPGRSMESSAAGARSRS